MERGRGLKTEERGLKPSSRNDMSSQREGEICSRFVYSAPRLLVDDGWGRISQFGEQHISTRIPTPVFFVFFNASKVALSSKMDDCRHRGRRR